MSAANTWSCCSGENGKMGPFLKPGWSPINTILMIVGFIVFFPLGLAMLAWNIMGHRWGSMKSDFGHSFSVQRNWTRGAGNWDAPVSSKTGNVAFDEYRTAELARLEEERRKIDDMRKDFDDHINNLRRARDQEEFNNFLNARGAEKNKTSKGDDDKIDV